MHPLTPTNTHRMKTKMRRQCVSSRAVEFNTARNYLFLHSVKTGNEMEKEQKWKKKAKRIQANVSSQKQCYNVTLSLNEGLCLCVSVFV